MSSGADPREYKSDIAGVFSRAAGSYGQIGPPFFDYFADSLIDYVEVPGGATVLDLATGTGAALRAAARVTGKTGTVVGVDISFEMALSAKKMAEVDGVANASLCVMDVERLGFTDESFDIVLCAMGLMFLPDLPAVIRRITYLLRRPGRIGISTFGGQDEVSKRLVELAQSYGVSKHLFWTPLRSREEHKQLLEQFGFEQIETSYEEADFVYADNEEWWSMNWTAGLRGILEEIPDDQLGQFKLDAFRSLGEYAQDDGIHHPRNALYTKAWWPGT